MAWQGCCFVVYARRYVMFATWVEAGATVTFCKALGWCKECELLLAVDRCREVHGAVLGYVAERVRVRWIH